MHAPTDFAVSETLNSTMANRTRIVAAKFLTGGINGLSRQMLCWAHQCSSESDERTVMNDGQNTGNCGLATWQSLQWRGRGEID